MTNEELISKIKAEIERRIELHDSLASNAESEMIANLEIGAAQALDDILPFLSTLESEKPIIPNDLEEVAIEYAKAYTENDNGNGGDDWEDDIKITFIAGAKWQEEKNQETIKLAEDHAFLAGADWQKEQMMKAAVEGEVVLNPYPTICLDDCKDYDFNDGDKVRVVILPKED